VHNPENKKLIVLASASPRRKKLLEQIGLEFIQSPSDVDENLSDDLSPVETVAKLASLKASEVANQFQNALIIAADTIVVFNSDILGKPIDKDDAVRILQILSGNTHLVITGVSLRLTDENGRSYSSCDFYEQTKVTFAALTQQEIEAYIDTGSPFDKAGAYGIQDDWGSVFVSSIEGDYYNVVGFPLHTFYQKLKTFAPDFLPKPTIHHA
jgi:septum formation protein